MKNTRQSDSSMSQKVHTLQNKLSSWRKQSWHDRSGRERKGLKKYRFKIILSYEEVEEFPKEEEELEEEPIYSKYKLY